MSKPTLLIALLLIMAAPVAAQQTVTISADHYVEEVARLNVVAAGLRHERDQLRATVQQLQAEMAKLKAPKEEKK